MLLKTIINGSELVSIEMQNIDKLHVVENKTFGEYAVIIASKKLQYKGIRKSVAMNT
jgi:hypothetical protein